MIVKSEQSAIHYTQQHVYNDNASLTLHKHYVQICVDRWVRVTEEGNVYTIHAIQNTQT